MDRFDLSWITRRDVLRTAAALPFLTAANAAEPQNVSSSVRAASASDADPMPLSAGRS